MAQRTSRRNRLQPFLAFLRGNASIVLMVVGAMLLGYVSFEYFSMWHEQRVLAEEWKQQNSSQVASAGSVPQASRADALTRIEIPRIHVDAIVVEGSGRRQLKIGPGRVTSTAQPGENGNAVITAHRDTFFRHVSDLHQGDDILVRRNGQVYRYQVTGRKIVDPDDVSVLEQTPDAELTLITCYPTYYIGPAPQRLVVSSKLVETKPETSQSASQTASTQAAATPSAAGGAAADVRQH